jgi:hypothetical protein
MADLLPQFAEAAGSTVAAASMAAEGFTAAGADKFHT